MIGKYQKTAREQGLTEDPTNLTSIATQRPAPALVDELGDFERFGPRARRNLAIQWPEIRDSESHQE